MGKAQTFCSLTNTCLHSAHKSTCFLDVWSATQIKLLSEGCVSVCTKTGCPPKTCHFMILTHSSPAQVTNGCNLKKKMSTCPLIFCKRGCQMVD